MNIRLQSLIEYIHHIIVLSFLKVIEIPAAIVGESAGFIVWYALLTGIVEVLFLINIFSKSAREENKSN